MSSNTMTISEDMSPIILSTSEYTGFIMSPTVEGEFPS